MSDQTDQATAFPSSPEAPGADEAAQAETPPGSSAEDAPGADGGPPMPNFGDMQPKEPPAPPIQAIRQAQPGPQLPVIHAKTPPADPKARRSYIVEPTHAPEGSSVEAAIVRDVPDESGAKAAYYTAHGITDTSLYTLSVKPLQRV